MAGWSARCAQQALVLFALTGCCACVSDPWSGGTEIHSEAPGYTPAEQRLWSERVALAAYTWRQALGEDCPFPFLLGPQTETSARVRVTSLVLSRIYKNRHTSAVYSLRTANSCIY